MSWAPFSSFRPSLSRCQSPSLCPCFREKRRGSALTGRQLLAPPSTYSPEMTTDGLTRRERTSLDSTLPLIPSRVPTRSSAAPLARATLASLPDSESRAAAPADQARCTKQRQRKRDKVSEKLRAISSSRLEARNRVHVNCEYM